MGLRAKLLLTVSALGALAVALNLLQYRAGALAVEGALRADARANVAQLTGQLDARLAETGDPREAARVLGEYAATVERREQPPAGGEAAAQPCRRPTRRGS
jgi:hypothetical protein